MFIISSEQRSDFPQSHHYGVRIPRESKHSKAIQSPDDKHYISHQQLLMEEELPRAF